MNLSRNTQLILGGVLGIVLISLGIGVWLYSNQPINYSAAVLPHSGEPKVKATSTPVVMMVKHRATPAAVKALYMTQCYASSPKLRERLLKIASTTEINSIVIDLKDYSGTVAFSSSTTVPGAKGCMVKDFKELVEQMHDQDLYVIGRLTVFQDPLYTKAYPQQAVQSASKGGVWRDRKGLAFVDVSSKPYWEYATKLAREAYELGIDEINFDYIRYPSDGNMQDARYVQTGASHPENLEHFFAALTAGVRAGYGSTTPVLSADLFGMTTTNYDDLNIGQVLERALPYFDFIDPMVYPSHFPPNFNGWSDPNKHPYDIIYYTMLKAVARTVATSSPVDALTHVRIGTSTPARYEKPAYSKYKIRPWLQDFNYPVVYTPEMVKTQIEATYNAGLNSWLMWDPANRYSTGVY